MIVHNFDPVLIDFGIIQIRWYSLSYILGILLGWWYGKIILKKQDWTFEGIFGMYDDLSLQRGLQVYQEVCSVCHSMKRLRFRELKDLGFTEDQIKKYSETFEITDGPNELGEMFTRPGEPSDTFCLLYTSPSPRD